MSISKTYSVQLKGLTPEIITIEVDITNGLHSFSIVGLGDRSIEEAKDRISAAIKNSGFTSPKQKNQKIIISLAPADVRKEGPSFDLGMAMAYLLASGEVYYTPENKIFLGELSLEGKVHKINGILPILCKIKSFGFTEIFIPTENSEEAALAKDLSVYPVSNLNEIISHFQNKIQIQRLTFTSSYKSRTSTYAKDMQIIKGNELAKRGLEIAAAGAHNVALYGPPGTGKTLLAQCFPSILPDLTYEESVEVTGIHSISNVVHMGLITRPPFRSPHHTVSYPALVGGGSFPKPGEITLAHRGILFMDEFTQFDSALIEALRQPIEDHEITISRARGSVTFPAQCILIISMNPCPCGKIKERGCKCSLKAIENYQRKISGPIADRIDLWINVDKVDYKKLGGVEDNGSETSSTILERVKKARMIQKQRFIDHNLQKNYNSEISSVDIDTIIDISHSAKMLLLNSSEKLGLSARGFHRILKVARTIADLGNQVQISDENILEAIQYRTKILF